MPKEESFSSTACLGFSSHTRTPHVWEWSRLFFSYSQVRDRNLWTGNDGIGTPLKTRNKINCQLNVLRIPFE